MLWVKVNNPQTILIIYQMQYSIYPKEVDETGIK